MARSESGSITKLDNNRWRVRVSGGNDPVTGKRIRKTKVVHGTKKDAIAERTRMLVEVGEVDRAVKDMTVEEFIESVYLPWEEKRVRDTTFYRMRRELRRSAIPALGHIKLRKVSPYTIETWLSSIESAGVRYNAFKTMRQAFKQAYKWDMVSRNVFDKVDKPTYTEGDKTVADADLGCEILQMIYDAPIEAPLLLQLSCGMRLSEAMAIDWEDIDWKTGKVHIWRNYQYVPLKGTMFFEPKTEKSNRYVTIPKGVLARLNEIRTSGGMIRSGALSIGLDGERMNPNALRYQYKKMFLRELPGVPYITPKNLRHSHATILLTQGVDLKTIAERLGHRDIKITMRNYLQHVDELDERASDAFDLAVHVASPAKDEEPQVLDFKPAKEA